MNSKLENTMMFLIPAFVLSTILTLVASIFWIADLYSSYVEVMSYVNLGTWISLIIITWLFYRADENSNSFIFTFIGILVFISALILLIWFPFLIGLMLSVSGLLCIILLAFLGFATGIFELHFGH